MFTYNIKITAFSDVQDFKVSQKLHFRIFLASRNLGRTYRTKWARFGGLVKQFNLTNLVMLND